MEKLSGISRKGIAFASLLFLATFKFPFWWIYLSAPQYPEGLRMYIWLNRLTGDVNIINGLNHYIGMGIIDEKTFPEFKILPYLIIFCFVAGLIVAAWGKRILFLGYTIFLWLLSIVSLYDFWRWEYVYGHNLDPDAAIQIPGMSYQPPLIGYKKLLNFEAYSAPHGGGWFYISAVGLVTIIFLYEFLLKKKFSPKKKFFIFSK